MNRKILYLLPLIVAVAVTGAPQSAEAIDLRNEKYKVVVNFELAGNPNVIRGSYQQDVAPQLNDMYDDFGFNTFDKTGPGAPNNPYGYLRIIYAAAFQVIGTNPALDNQYQIYPLIKITGDKPDLTQEEYNTDKDIVLALQRTAIVDFLQAEGAYNVSTYIHYSFGPVWIDEGF